MNEEQRTMKTEHNEGPTPGPWFIHDGKDFELCDDDQLLAISDESGNYCIASVDNDPRGRANARVIAASAAMFEALITCVNKLHEKIWPDCGYEFDGPSAEFICEGCAAIAQAKGEKIEQAKGA